MIEPVTIPDNPWLLTKVIVEIPAEAGVAEETGIPIPIFFSVRSAVSLVILFFKSLVTTSPIGNLFANDFAAGGFEWALSRSICG